MKLDLRKERKPLLKYIKERARQYPIYINAGPGEDEDAITQITCGYQFDQAGWIAMVFDTRPAAAVDGQWQNYIEDNEYEVAHWCEVYQVLYESNNTVDLIDLDGRRVSLEPDDDLASVLGEFLRELLTSCRDEGVFDKLPCADHCRLTVEEHEGAYGWTEPQEDGKDESGDDPFAVSDSVKAEAAKLDQSKQVKFWIGRLANIAADTKRDPEDFDYDVDGNVEPLAEIGNKAVVPMLKLAVELSGQSQYRGDGSGAMALYRSWVLEQLIQKAEEMEHATPEIEKLLRTIVAKAVKVNSARKLWGSAAFFAARALFNLFDKYPCPELGDSNELVDPAPFL